jgi:hypothetical protein
MILNAFLRKIVKTAGFTNTHVKKLLFAGLKCVLFQIGFFIDFK